MFGQNRLPPPREEEALPLRSWLAQLLTLKRNCERAANVFLGWCKFERCAGIIQDFWYWILDKARASLTGPFQCFWIGQKEILKKSREKKKKKLFISHSNVPSTLFWNGIWVDSFPSFFSRLGFFTFLYLCIFSLARLLSDDVGVIGKIWYLVISKPVVKKEWCFYLKKRKRIGHANVGIKRHNKKHFSLS